MGGSVRKLGPDKAQVEYRLTSQSGCDTEIALTQSENDDQLQQRLGSGERPLEWVGSGLSEFGIVAGTRLTTVEDLDRVRALMDGRDPHTQERLVDAKTAVHPDAKLRARELVEAVRQVSEAAHMSHAQLLGSATLVERFEQLERGVEREGEAHYAPLAEMAPIANAVGVDPSMLWAQEDLERAKVNADRRVRVGNRGYDLVIDLPKSWSMLAALGEQSLTDLVEDTFLESVRETVAAVEGWVAYGMTGHHGDGRTGQPIDTSGLLGTVTLHRSARGVEGQVGDPHLHAHIMLANMVKCVDGKWRTVAAGGRDLFRHGGPASAFLEARMRAKMRERLQLKYAQDERTKAWEILPIDSEKRAVFSRRNTQITALAGPGATSAQTKVIGARLAEAKKPLPPADIRRLWRQRALEAGIDPATLIADVLGGGGQSATSEAPTPPTPDDIARVVFDPHEGVTANRKVARRTDVLRAVLHALPHGVPDLATAERLTDQVLASPGVVRLPDAGGAHMSNTARYTTTDVLAAERSISAHARRRRHSGCARVPVKAARRVLDATERRQGFSFTPGQRRVLERLVEEGHGVDAVIGVAGAGKTTIMSAARQVWESHGLRVGGAATAAVAAANLHAEAGIRSRTVASLLARLDRGRGLGEIDVLVLDEAAMIDDRALARLLEAARDQGVKVVGIGDPKQLRAVGIGGGFAAIHRHVEGLALEENMRQRVQVDREALRTWREGTDQARFSALAQWVKADRVHAGETTQDTYVAALARWWKDTEEQSGALDVIDNVLLLAGRNSDVEELNLRARSLFRYDKRLKGRDVTFSLAGGSRIDLAKGDIVRVRANDYRSRRDARRSDVLNGYRARVVKVHRRHGALIQWRREGATTQEWVSPSQIARGHLSHGYAMTVAAAQGLTARKAHVYGLGIDGHTLYSAMSRAKLRTDLYLPLNVLEDLEERAERGEARDGGERARRAVVAYAETINEADDRMVSEESFQGGRRGSSGPEVVNEPLGSHASELVRRREALTAAVGALERVGHAADAVVRAGDEVRVLEERVGRGRFSLLREGSSRSRERARLDQARQVLEQARGSLERERRSARGFAVQAGVAVDAETIRSAHGALTRDWDRLWDQAVRKDRGEGRQGASVRGVRSVVRPVSRSVGKSRGEVVEPPAPKRG